jgi:hypothetical protein
MVGFTVGCRKYLPQLVINFRYFLKTAIKGRANCDDQGLKLGVEGAIPAKGKAFGETGGIGQGNPRGGKQMASGLRDLGELSARFREQVRPQQDLGSPMSGHSSLSRPATQTGAGAQGSRLSESARSITAMLSDEHVAEAEEAAAGKRLAARFVRRPGDKASGPPKSSLAPYLTAGAFVLLAAGAAAYYFIAPGAEQTAGGSYVSASFTSPFSSGSSAAQAAPEWPQQPGTKGPDSPGWTETVETFRAFAGTGATAPAEKAAEPQLERLAAGYTGAP